MILSKLRLLVALVVTSANAVAASGTWVLRADGIGPVKIGMSLSQMNAVLNETFSKPERKDDQGCFYVDATYHPHIHFMIENGRLVRVDIDGKGISTAKGIRVGDSEIRVLQVYDHSLKVEPNAYTGPEGHYLTMRSKSGRYGIRFETENGKVEMFYAGRFDAIQYIEGCE